MNSQETSSLLVFLCEHRYNREAMNKLSINVDKLYGYHFPYLL